MSTTLSLPLSVARETLKSVPTVWTILRETSQEIEFLTFTEDSTSYLSRIVHTLYAQTVVVGMQYQDLFPATEAFTAFVEVADGCLRTMLEHGESALPGYARAAQFKRRAGLQYVVPIRYAAMSDSEYSEALETALVQCGKAMSLMYSVLDDMYESQKSPTAKSCMRSIYRASVLFLPKVSAREAAGLHH